MIAELDKVKAALDAAEVALIAARDTIAQQDADLAAVCGLLSATRKDRDMARAFIPAAESCHRLADYMSTHRDLLEYDGCDMAGDGAIRVLGAMAEERDVLRAQVAELTAGIDAVIDRKRIAEDKPEILHTIQRHYEIVCETAGKANDTIEDIGKALKIDALESDDIVADVRAHVAELTRHGASIHKAAGAARRAERADVVAWLRSGDWPSGPTWQAIKNCIDQSADAIERGAHEGAATPK